MINDKLDKKEFAPQYQQQMLEKQNISSDFQLKSIEIKQFLNLVLEGQLSQAEDMLKINPALSQEKGNITDYANRTFRDITGFQYAVWSLDWEMWEMIKKYCSYDQIEEQAQQCTEGEWIKEYGECVHWNDLIKALNIIAKNHTNWDYEECNQFWIKQIGGQQLTLPRHVLYEYYYPHRSFDPIPDFTSLGIKRCFLISCKNLGVSYAICKGSYGIHNETIYVNHISQALSQDSFALNSLYNTRNQQRKTMLDNLVMSRIDLLSLQKHNP